MEESRTRFWGRVEPELSALRAFLRRLGVRDADLDDATQEVLIHVHRRWSDYDPERPVRSWLFGFAVRVAKAQRRAGGSTTNLVGSDADSLRDGAPTPEATLEDRRRRALLLAALDALDEERRTVFVLMELEEMSAPQVSELLGVALNTVYSRLRLARTDLTAAVKRLRARGEAP